MVRIDVHYEGGLHCQAIHAPSGAVLATDAPVDNHGRGEAFSPTDLVATALATCMATTMGIVADRHGWKIDGASLVVTKEMTSEGPRRIRRLAVAIECPAPSAADPDAGAQAVADAKKTLEQTAHNCPVRISLLPAIEVPVEFRWR
jgi:putative redox protein